MAVIAHLDGRVALECKDAPRVCHILDVIRLPASLALQRKAVHGKTLAT